MFLNRRKSCSIFALLIVEGCLLLGIGQEAVAIESDANSGASSATITPGTYSGEGGYFSRIVIKPWANTIIVTGLTYYGDIQLNFETDLFDSGRDTFAGHGNIVANYEDGSACRFPIRLKITASPRGLFVESRQPSSVPEYADACDQAGEQVLLIHPNPYRLVPKGHVKYEEIETVISRGP